jgi:transcriptional regulator with XRE-family HTH domain
MQSIGERLEEARKRKGISIREAAEATKIRSDYLHKFESNQFDIKLPDIYVRGFLRTYANYLKLPADKIVSDFNALGINAPSARQLNREIYGKMDLSISSAKNEKDGKETNPPVPEAEPTESATRNPATFIPKGTSGPSIDRNLLIKLVGMGVAAVLVLGILLYFVFGRGEKAPPTSKDMVWEAPQAGESVITLHALDRARVTVTQTSTGKVLFSGVLTPLDMRDVPRRGKLRIATDTPENLRVKIGNNEFELRDPKTGGLLKTAEIDGGS